MYVSHQRTHAAGRPAHAHPPCAIAAVGGADSDDRLRHALEHTATQAGRLGDIDVTLNNGMLRGFLESCL